MVSLTEPTLTTPGIISRRWIRLCLLYWMTCRNAVLIATPRLWCGGEFGRTPKINPRGGRDHWPQVGCALLAGGGIRTGQVIGETNPRAEHPTKRPVHFQEVFATLYHNLGINVDRDTIRDLSGRPQYLVDHAKYQPLPEVV